MEHAWRTFFLLALILVSFNEVFAQNSSDSYQQMRMFRRDFRAAVLAMHQNDEAGAERILSKISSPDRLAELYRRAILAKLYISMGSPLAADSILNTGRGAFAVFRHIPNQTCAKFGKTDFPYLGT